CNRGCHPGSDGWTGWGNSNHILPPAHGEAVANLVIGTVVWPIGVAESAGACLHGSGWGCLGAAIPFAGKAVGLWARTRPLAGTGGPGSGLIASRATGSGEVLTIASRDPWVKVAGTWVKDSELGSGEIFVIGHTSEAEAAQAGIIDAVNASRARLVARGITPRRVTLSVCDSCVFAPNIARASGLPTWGALDIVSVDMAIARTDMRLFLPVLGQ